MYAATELKKHEFLDISMDLDLQKSIRTSKILLDIATNKLLEEQKMKTSKVKVFDEEKISQILLKKALTTAEANLKKAKTAKVTVQKDIEAATKAHTDAKTAAKNADAKVIAALI